MLLLRGGPGDSGVIKENATSRGGALIDSGNKARGGHIGIVGSGGRKGNAQPTAILHRNPLDSHFEESAKLSIRKTASDFLCVVRADVLWTFAVHANAVPAKGRQAAEHASWSGDTSESPALKNLSNGKLNVYCRTTQ